MKNTTTINKRILIFLIAVFLIMTLLTFITPIGGDDFIYSFNDSSSVRPLNFYDIYKNMEMQREFVTARVVSHFLVELFLMLPKYIFNIVNGLIITAVVYLLYRYIKTGNAKLDTALLFMCVALIWCLMPVFGQIFFWLDGSCNYGWAIFLILLYLYPFYSYYSDSSRLGAVSIVLHCLMSLVMGAYSENGSLAAIGISVCLILVLLFRRQRIPWYLVVFLLLASAGYCFLMTAPVITGGNKVESSLGTAKLALVVLSALVFTALFIYLAIKKSGIFKYVTFAVILMWLITVSFVYKGSIKDIFTSTYFLLPTIIFLFTAFLCWSIYKKIDPKTLIFCFILFLAGIGSILVFAFAIYFPARSCAYITVFYVLGIVLMIRELDVKIQKVSVSVLIILFAVNFIFGSADIVSIHKQYNERMRIISQAHRDGVNEVFLDRYRYSTKYTSQYGIDDIGDDPSQCWINRYLADYYELDFVYSK